MTTATQSEFAAILGKDKSYVTRLKQAGRLVLTAEGLVDVQKSRALIDMTADPSRADAVAARQKDQTQQRQSANPGGDTIGTNYQTAKAVNEKYKALTAKAEYEQLIGKLVDAEEARLFATDLAATFRGQMETLWDRLAPEVVALNDIEAIRAVMVEHGEHILNEIADKVAAWGKE